MLADNASTTKAGLISSFDPRRSFVAKLALVITILLSTTLAVVTFITIQTVQSTLSDQIGGNLESQAESLGDVVAVFLDEKTSELQVLTSFQMIKHELVARNAGYEGDATETLAEIVALDEHWVEAPDDDPLVRQIMSSRLDENLVGNHLADFLRAFPEHTEVFITDRFGATVAATGRLSDYYQADEGWWQAGWNGGQGAVFVSDPEYDQSAGVTALLISMPISDDETGEIIGILRSTLNVEGLYRLLGSVAVGETGYGLLLNEAGAVIYDPRLEAGATVSTSENLVPQELLHEDSGFAVAASTIFGHASLTHGHDHSGPPASFPGSNGDPIDPGWSVVVRQAEGEALASVDSVIRVSSVAGTIAVLIGAVVALIVARAVTRPLVELGGAAEEIGGGNLDVTVPASGNDEIGRLAASFGRMKERLRSSIAALREANETLEERVEERTGELSNANGRLQTEIIERQRAQDAQQQLVAILEATPDFVETSAPDGRIVYLNRAARGALGLTEHADISQMTLADTHPEWTHDILKHEAIPAAIRDGVWTGEGAWAKGDGAERPASIVLLSHTTESGSVEALSTISRDISERKQLESQLTEAANHDSLTGLINRRRFETVLQATLATDLPKGRAGALLFLDLDQFKDVNDSRGHPAGDQVLAELAQLLRQTLRETDVIARLGGDEFTVLLTGTGASEARTVAEKLLDAVGRHSFRAAEEFARMTLSIGAALYPDHGMTWDALLSHADLAMYRAKAAGRNRVCFYSGDEHSDADPDSRLNWRGRIHEALEKDRFLLYAQPIADLRRNEVSQYELLLRMTTEKGKILLPAAFLDIADQTGSIQMIERWVVLKAISMLAEFRRSGWEPVLEVNLSGRALADEKLVPLIRSELEQSGVNPRSLILEVTETAAVSNISQAKEFVGSLRSLGCRFALDDFGVGVSSFFLLKHLPVDFLKIDGSFVTNLPHSEVDQHIVQAMADVARGMGMETIAEYVQDEETVELLRSYGVGYAQGFHIGRPGPVPETVVRPSHTTDRVA